MSFEAEFDLSSSKSYIFCHISCILFQMPSFDEVICGPCWFLRLFQAETWRLCPFESKSVRVRERDVDRVFSPFAKQEAPSLGARGEGLHLPPPSDVRPGFVIRSLAWAVRGRGTSPARPPTLHQKRKWIKFEFPKKIPIGYELISKMLPENPKIKKIYRGNLLSVYIYTKKLFFTFYNIFS